jgi:hypothetical protein
LAWRHLHRGSGGGLHNGFARTAVWGCLLGAVLRCAWDGVLVIAFSASAWAFRQLFGTLHTRQALFALAMGEL